MSLEHLKKHGHLRDESEWPESHARSPVHLGSFIGATVVGLVGCLLMTLGNGGLWTWVGLVSFLFALFIFLGANLRSIGRPTTGPAAQRIPEPPPDDATPPIDLE